MTADTFKAQLWRHGNSIIITIPANVIKFGGYTTDDVVKVMITKHKGVETNELSLQRRPGEGQIGHAEECVLGEHENQ